jgi:hypothetical protein
MNLSLKRTNLFALEIFALAVALVVVSSPYVHGQEIAHLNPIPKPGKSVVSTAIPSHPQTPVVYTDWMPARVVWSSTPDFLSSFLALAHFMRLSSMKAAHADAGGAPCRKSGYVGRK